MASPRPLDDSAASAALTAPGPAGDGPISNLTAWHSLTAQQALAQLQGNAQQGLSSSAAQAAQQRYGPNELVEQAGRSTLQIWIDQFTNIMLLMLMAVAVVSAAVEIRGGGFPKDAVAIAIIVILNGVLGYLQESRAEDALAALKQLSSPTVRVLRDGQVRELAANQLVPGDVMLLEAGVQVAADGRLLEAANLQVRESTLTGEAEAVTKQAALVLEEDAALGDRLNLVYQGTEVVQGRGKVLVTRTGMQTELGHIARMLQNVAEDPTPLQQRMDQLAKVLVYGSLAIVAAVVVLGMLLYGPSKFEELLEVSLSMAVAVVPEGLPAVITVTLAIGTQRMVRRNALIRKLPAVETLGSVTTICSDKTGTLTQNKMVAQVIRTLAHDLQVSGQGYEPQGSYQQRSSAEPVEAALASPEVQILLLNGLLCNDAGLRQDEGSGWEIWGDPTEAALLPLAAKAGHWHEDWAACLQRVDELPFSSERKRMTVLCRPDSSGAKAGSWAALAAGLGPRVDRGDYVLFTKGSPELTLGRCTTVQVGDRRLPLGSLEHQQILRQNEQLASQGLRVLGFAYQTLPERPSGGLSEGQETQLTWLGLVGLWDAPRPEVREAVLRCRRAGIRPVMITGDQALTAQAIAHDLGIATPGDPVIEGKTLATMDEATLRQTVQQINVYARVAPEHKLRIVQALQQDGKTVAMTGDGVNDAPALKQADIGIAMGITGTDVSKEASDMVLLDDNFATIVAATEEGRVVYSNIRRFIKYILGSNVGEVLTIGAAPLVGLGGSPLTPLQILWMNLVTDGLPALALAVEPAGPNVMDRTPYHPRESVFARGLGWYILRIGMVFAALTITMMLWAYGYTHSGGANGTALGRDPERWRTMVFTTLCLSQMGHAIAARSSTRLTLEMPARSNPYIWAAVFGTIALQLLLIYVPVLRNFFGTQLISLQELMICCGFSSLIFIWVEGEKVMAKLRRRSTAPRSFP
ncbi:MAG: HAD-IC family P-type ATPase [Synechococcales cyanobacterium RM1_1_8]|nr:HAD-IC family P-type ATPase [Synechococcales cyanobacterium RM1_1_8]